MASDYPTIKVRAATLVQLRLTNNLLNIYLRSKRFRATPSLARIYQNEILGYVGYRCGNLTVLK